MIPPRPLLHSPFRLAALLALGLSLGACQKKDPPNPEPQPVMSVELVSPQRAMWSETLLASGNIAAWEEAVIGAEVGGTRLLQVLVNVGDVVRKGQELARLDPALLEAQLRQRDAELAQAEATLAGARADANRAEQLVQAGSISQQEALQYRTNAATATAQQQLALAQRDLAALNLRYTRVVAPDDGVISARTATVGSLVSSGSELFRMIRGQRLEWRAEVPGDELDRLQPGMDVALRRPDGGEIRGRLRQLAPTVNTSTRSALAYVDLPTDSGLHAGQFVSGQFTLSEREAQYLPESSIVLRDGHSYVMSVGADRHVQQIKVETGRRRDHAIEIISELAADLQLIRAGGAFLGDGDLVSIGAAQVSAGEAP